MKKIFALILALLMITTLFAGCGNIDDVEIIDATYDETIEADIVLLIDAFNDADGNGYNLEYTEFGEPTTVGSIEILLFEGGKTVGECFADDGYENLRLVEEDNDNFLGWIEYEITVKVDSDGCQYNTFKKATDELLTTEEVLNKTMPDHSMGYIAKWKDTPQEDYDYIESIK